MRPWTQELVEEAQRLRAGGLTMAQIGRRLGRSKNSVISRLRRQGFIRPPRTHCLRGHPFSGANLYVDPHGRRACRACHRERARKNKPPDWWREEMAEEAPRRPPAAEQAFAAAIARAGANYASPT